MSYSNGCTHKNRRERAVNFAIYVFTILGFVIVVATLTAGVMYISVHPASTVAR